MNDHKKQVQLAAFKTITVRKSCLYFRVFIIKNNYDKKRGQAAGLPSSKYF
jgi:hypothetical protein